MLSGCTLLETNNHIYSVINTPSYDPIQEGYDFLLENETYNHDLNIRYMKLLIEASTYPYVINEGFTDIISKCIEGIKNFIKWVGEQFSKLFNWIKGTVTTDKKISKSKVEDLDKNVTVSIEGYKYTLSKIINSFENIIENSNMTGYGGLSNFVMLCTMDIDELKGKYDEFKSTTSTEISKLRGKLILNKDVEMSKDEFNDNIFMTLRNNKSEKETIKFNYSDIQELLNYINNDYPKFAATMDDIKQKIIKRFTIEIKRLEEFKNAQNKISGDNKEKYQIINSYMVQAISVKNQEKEVYITLVSNICKAIKDAFSQAKYVINQASVNDTKERFHIKDGDK